MKLSTLKRKAAKQAKMNGHKLKWGNLYGTPTSNSQNAFCKHCGGGVACHENLGLVYTRGIGAETNPTMQRQCSDVVDKMMEKGVA